MMSSNYSEDGVEFVFFDHTKYDKLIQTQFGYYQLAGHDVGSKLIEFFRDSKRKTTVTEGLYSMRDIGQYFLSPFRNIFEKPNVGVMTLPITRYNGGIFYADRHSYADFVSHVSKGGTFLLYHVSVDFGGNIAVRGVKV